MYLARGQVTQQGIRNSICVPFFNKWRVAVDLQARVQISVKGFYELTSVIFFMTTQGGIPFHLDHLY